MLSITIGQTVAKSARETLQRIMERAVMNKLQELLA
jgi:hypothetical protein